MDTARVEEQDARIAHITSDIKRFGSKGLRRRFYCPILHVEEVTNLCKGHLLPQAVGGIGWVVQRKDVDNFFGSFANAGFSHGTKLQGRDFESALQYVIDKGLAGRANLSVHDEKGIKRRIHTTKWKDGRLGLLVPQAEELDFTKPVAVGFELDVRYDTLLSCIHSLHLGLFKERGYKYVDCRPGQHNAAFLRDVYKAFSTGSKGKDKNVERLAEICGPYQNMVRPVLLSDTIDRKLIEKPFQWCFVCWNESTQVPFAAIHFLKADKECAAVMSFLNLDESAGAIVCSETPISFKTTLGHLTREKDEVWALHKKTERMIWPCGDGDKAATPCPIEVAAEEFSRKWN